LVLGLLFCVGCAPRQEQVWQIDKETISMTDVGIPVYKSGTFEHGDVGMMQGKLLGGAIFKDAGFYGQNDGETEDAIFLKFDIGEIFGYGKAPSSLIVGKEYVVTWGHSIEIEGMYRDSNTDNKTRIFNCPYHIRIVDR